MGDQRIEEYRRPDGTWSTDRRRDAAIALPLDVVTAVRAVGTIVSERYYLGTAQHESNYAINERDTEPADSQGVRFQSWGIYQLSVEEAGGVGRPNANLLDLTVATWIMVKLTEQRRSAIRAELRLDDLAPDPHGLEAYLAIAHNQGLKAARATIRIHGLDWRGYKARNPTIAIVRSGYGDDCLPRGPDVA